MKIVSIVGARPQFIKLQPLSLELRKKYTEIILHTGQHYDFEMSKLFFDDLKIPRPDYNLGIGSGLHGEQTAKMLIEIEKVLLKEKPDLVLIFGDTNSTLSGALAAVKLHIKIGHIESGLRSYNKKMPEEINRIIADHCSELLFCPTKTSVVNLKKEGITKGVHLTGDIMCDALQNNLKIAKKSNILKNLKVKSKEYYLTTVHRQENTNNIDNLMNIIQALSKIKGDVIFPVHPRTIKFIKKNNLEKEIKKNVKMIKPVGYLDFIWLIKNSKKILTDSGGITKEAYMLKIPCITLREKTEWVETVEDKWNVLVGTNQKKILDAVNNFDPKNKQKKHYGEGKASIKIKKIIDSFF